MGKRQVECALLQDFGDYGPDTHQHCEKSDTKVEEVIPGDVLETARGSVPGVCLVPVVLAKSLESTLTMYPKHSSVHLKTWTLSQFFLPNNFEKAEFILTNFNLNSFMLVSLKSTYNHSSFCVITKTIILRMYPFNWHLKCTPLRSPTTYCLPCVHMYVCFSWSCHRNPDTFMMAFRIKHQIGRE